LKEKKSIKILKNTSIGFSAPCRPGVPGLLGIGYVKKHKKINVHLMVFLSNCVPPSHTSRSKSTEKCFCVTPTGTGNVPLVVGVPQVASLP
jgi:hypothetical protein